MIDYASGAHGFNPATRIIPVQIDTTFPKGMAFAEWLVNVGASTTSGQINLQAAEHSVDGVFNGAQRWIYGTDPDRNTPMVQHLSFNTPVGVPEAEACGRVVYTGLHVSNSVEDRTEQPPGFPGLCEMSELTAQEKAVAFMLFDLSACIQNEDEPPKPPK